MKAKIKHSPGHGKKIDTVYYDVEQVVSSDGQNDRKIFRKVAIDVYLQKALDTNPDSPAPAATTDMCFLARCEETKDTSSGTDIGAILKDLRSKLDERFKIRWERWLLVKVDRARAFHGSGEGLTLSWDDVQRGVCFDGSVLLRRYNPYGNFNSRWIVEPWPEVVKEDGRIVAVIKATEQNEEALAVFAQKIAELRKALASLVAPDAIEQTLKEISNSQLAALMAPKDS